MQRRTLIQALAVPAAGGWAGTALAATEPLFAGKAPLRIVVGYPPGGATDRVARIVADRLQARLGSPVVVENKPGACWPGCAPTRSRPMWACRPRAACRTSSR
jgi:hypothetical protein